ncbi:hypothetical protein KXW64_008550, partial [Aspergillus fumigatus]
MRGIASATMHIAFTPDRENRRFTGEAKRSLRRSMMTNMKKILGAGTALALLLGVSACGSGSSSSSSSATTKTAVTLTVWGPSEDQANSSSWLPKMETAFQKAHPEYKITWKNSVVAEGEAATTVKQDASAAADVYMFSNDQLGILIGAGAIGQLSTSVAKQVKSQNDSSMVTS